MQRDTKAERLVDYDSRTILVYDEEDGVPPTAFNEIRRDYSRLVFTGARVFGRDIGHCLWGQLFVDGSSGGEA